MATSSYPEDKILGGRSRRTRRGASSNVAALLRRRPRKRSTSNDDASAARSRRNRRWPCRACCRSGRARVRQQCGARGSDGEHDDGERERKEGRKTTSFCYLLFEKCLVSVAKVLFSLSLTSTGRQSLSPLQQQEQRTQQQRAQQQQQEQQGLRRTPRRQTPPLPEPQQRE